jgi:hypothetical protein
MPCDVTYMLTFVLQIVMNMAEDDPRRMDEIRKYAAIYGRFDCKRKPEKPLTLHEVSRSLYVLFSVWILHRRFICRPIADNPEISRTF